MSKRTLEGSQGSTAKRAKNAPIIMTEELEEFLASWWEENRALYDKTHPAYHLRPQRLETLRAKVIELQESIHWGNLEIVKTLNEERLGRVRIISFT